MTDIISIKVGDDFYSHFLHEFSPQSLKVYDNVYDYKTFAFNNCSVSKDTERYTHEYKGLAENLFDIKIETIVHYVMLEMNNSNLTSGTGSTRVYTINVELENILTIHGTVGDEFHDCHLHGRYYDEEWYIEKEEDSTRVFPNIDHGKHSFRAKLLPGDAAKKKEEAALRKQEDKSKLSSLDKLSGDVTQNYYSFDEVCDRHPEKNYEWLKERALDGRFEVCDTLESSKKAIEELKSVVKYQKEHPLDESVVIAMDTETSGLDIRTETEGYHNPQYGTKANKDKREWIERDHMVGIIFSIEKVSRSTISDMIVSQTTEDIQKGIEPDYPHDIHSWFFPVNMKYINSFWYDGVSGLANSDNNEDLDEVPKYLKEILEEGRFVGHNSAFDWKVLWEYGINTNFTQDTLTMVLMGYANEHFGTSAGLKDLTQFFLNRDPLELDDITVTGHWDEDSNFAELPKEVVLYYGCADGDDTLQLYEYMHDEAHFLKVRNTTGGEQVVFNTQYNYYGLNPAGIPQDGSMPIDSYHIEAAFQKVAGYQEYYGHHFDIANVNKLNDAVEKGMERVSAQLKEMGIGNTNMASSKQMKEWLVDRRHWEIKYYTATGNPSFSKKSLDDYAEIRDSEGKPKYPEAVAIKEQKKYMYLKSNFLSLVLGNPTGLIFSRVGWPEATGRVQISNPNYQSYSDEMREYITPREGMYMMDLDYSSVEYRILATLSGQTELMKFFHNPDADYHTYQASRMFNIPYGKVSKELRHEAKHINFGLPYGMGPRKLGANIFGEVNDINTAKASKLIDKYFQGQEKVKEFFVNARAETVQNHYSRTHFGRRRYFKPNERQDVMERQGGNMPIQGTAADIYKLGVVRLFNDIADKGLLGKFLISAFMHDEVLCEISDDIEPTVALDMLRNAMMVKNYGGNCRTVSRDGTPIQYYEAPLVMGGGFGSNWRDAKSTEIPVELQDTLSKTHIPWWNGDINTLYDWETYKIAEYYKDRVLKYLDTQAEQNSDVDVIIADYARDMMKFLAKCDDFKVEDSITEYGDWSSNGCPDWVDVDSFNSWKSSGYSIPSKPVDILNTAYYLLKGISDKCVQLGIVDPNEEDSQDDKPLSELEQRKKQNREMMMSVGFLNNNDRVMLWAPQVEGKFTQQNAKALITILNSKLGYHSDKLVWKDVILMNKDFSEAYDTNLGVSPKNFHWFKNFALQQASYVD
jgi:DNA polymerase I-like protein with 3'-5' exonuclease and polymerase domains